MSINDNQPSFPDIKPGDKVIIYFPDPPENQPPFQEHEVRKVGVVTFEIWSGQTYTRGMGIEDSHRWSNSRAFPYNERNAELMEIGNKEWERGAPHRALASEISKCRFDNLSMQQLKNIKRIIMGQEVKK